MLRYSLKRLLLAFVTAFIILTLTFILVKALPISLKVSTSAGERMGFYDSQVKLGYFSVLIKPESEHFQPSFNYIESFIDDEHNEYFYYPKPILEQYFTWIGNIFTQWDWGTSTSLEMGTSAIRLIGRRLPVTMSINIIVVLLSVPLGIALGVYAGLKKNTWIDHTISTLIMIFVSIPGFVVITFLIFFLSYQTGWLPPSWPSITAPLGTRALGYIIPVIALSFSSICGYGRGVRAELCEVMSSEYLLLARTKGLTKNQAIVRHALRNAFVPILPSILSEFIGILGGSIILEKLYGTEWNEPGRYNIEGIKMLIIRAAQQSPTAIYDRFMQVGDLDSCGIPSQYIDVEVNQPDVYQTKGNSTFKLNVNSCTQEMWDTLNKKLWKHTDSDKYKCKPWMSNDNFLNGLFYSIDRETFARKQGSQPYR